MLAKPRQGRHTCGVKRAKGVEVSSVWASRLAGDFAGIEARAIAKRREIDEPSLR